MLTSTVNNPFPMVTDTLVCQCRLCNTLECEHQIIEIKFSLDFHTVAFSDLETASPQEEPCGPKASCRSNFNVVLGLFLISWALNTARDLSH